MATGTTQSVIDQAKLSIVAYNEKNWDAAKQALSPDAVYEEVATHRRLEGVDSILPTWKEWATAFPDSRATFEREFATGDTVVLEMRWRGTHSGPLNLPTGKVNATNKSIDLRACQIVELKSGRTKAVRHYFDMATMMQQLGLNK